MEETSSLTNSIIQTINSIFQTLFSSIDNNIYKVLDDLVFIDSNILNGSIFEKIFGTNTSNGLLVIANSLLIGFSLYYAIFLQQFSHWYAYLFISECMFYKYGSISSSNNLR